MRRNDREVKDFDDIVGIIKRCDVCRLALNGGDGYPYILPLNFGFTATPGAAPINNVASCNAKGEKADSKITLYFHGATEGKKYELIKKDNRASFEMDCAHRLVTDNVAGNCTMEYESVIGRGTIEIVDDNDTAAKIEALDILMAQYPVPADFKYNVNIVARTTVMKMTVTEFTAKRRMKR